jgi:hypothetical protein
MFLERNVEKFGQLIEEIMDRTNSGSDVRTAESAPLLDAVPQ